MFELFEIKILILGDIQLSMVSGGAATEKR